MRFYTIGRLTLILVSLWVFLGGSLSSHNSVSAAGSICGQLVFYTPSGQTGMKFSSSGINPCGSNVTYALGNRGPSSLDLGNFFRFYDPVVIPITPINTEDKGRITFRLDSWSRFEKIASCQACNVQPSPTQQPARPTSPPPPLPQPPPSNPPQINFSVDQSTITQGQCVNLRWDIENVRAIFLDGQGVTGHETRQVCPPSTQTYTLRIVTNSGDQYRSVTVNVTEPPTPSQSVPQWRDATISADKTEIRLGEQYEVCYTIPAPAYIEITVTFEDGNSRIAIYGDDDGSGGCIQGKASLPVGKRLLRLTATSGGMIIGTAETSF